VLPILRTLHTGCTATGWSCGVIGSRGSSTSCTNSMLSWMQPVGRILHAGRRRAGVEDDRASVRPRWPPASGFELGRFQVAGVEQALLERLAAAQPASARGRHVEAGAWNKRSATGSIRRRAAAAAGPLSGAAGE
jgi:hypothetical protein